MRERLGGLVILYEDDDIAVVDKPSGLLSVQAGDARVKSAYGLLLEHMRRTHPGARPAVVHRLDRDTSGVMLFAKHPHAKKIFMDRWAERVLERRYVAVAEGRPQPPRGRIDTPLKENRVGEVYVSSDGTGLRALTNYWTLEGRDDFSLLELELETGRKNQIRVQLAHMGNPVAGDTKYGARADPLGRLALHAYLIAFLHPRTDERLEFRVDPPTGFLKMFRR